MTNKIFYFLIAVTFLFVSHNLRAAEIELGAGTFFTSLPKYLGSEEQNSYTLPFPYFYYRSDKLEIDRNSFTRYFWQQNNWYLDFSATGNLPVESNKTKIMKWNWGTGIVIGMLSFMSFILYLVITMSTDKNYSHDLVTDDYYAKEMVYQNEINAEIFEKALYLKEIKVKECMVPRTEIHSIELDANKKDLIWQGSGTGYLVTKNVEKKEARIKEFVAKTMTQFPPEQG